MALDTRDEEPTDAGYRDPDIDGCHHCRNPRTCEYCAQEAAHDRHIGVLVESLADHITEARTGVLNALSSIRDLLGPSYDIELAESADGPDGLNDLEAADKLLRNVERVVRERRRLLLLPEGLR